MRKIAPMALTLAISTIALTACSSMPLKKGKPNMASAQSSAAIGVNAYLWRATIDTLQFMPIASADPFGGTYITDWYSLPSKPDERFKVQVLILDTNLRADAVSAQVFRQVQKNSAWSDASVDPETSIQIENSILTRARQLKAGSAN